MVNDDLPVETADDPLVPPELIPAVEFPAQRPPAALWKSISVAVAFLVFLGVLVAAVVYYADAAWSDRAMVTTALTGLEALARGDAPAVDAVSTAALQQALTPQVLRRLRGTVADRVAFSPPRWQGDAAVVAATVGTSRGTLVLTPSTDGSDAVDFTTSGALGTGKGSVFMVIDWNGWKVGGVQLR